MLTYRQVGKAQIIEFLELLREDAADYLDQTLALMSETWEHFVEIAQQVGQVFGVYLNGQIAGYYWSEEREVVLHLHGILVLREFRGQGIGTTILKKLIQDYTPQMEAIELGVHDSNGRAKSLYENMGFVTMRREEELGFSVMQIPLNRKKPNGNQ